MFIIGLNVGCSAAVNWIQIKTELLPRFPPDARYLIGISGGRDSVTLLHWLISVGYKKLIVCHLNHQLRGRSSDADARFVQKLAETYQTGFERGAANIGALAKKKKMSIETAAREARYSFFAKAAKRHRCHTMFLAHHADDLVETFLLNLIRGAGLTGLAGMREVTSRHFDGVDLTIVRPLLSVWRTDIDKYVRERHLRFREDATNKTLAATRNRIRNRIIPYLEKILGRNIRHNIWRTAMIAAEEEKWIDNESPDFTNAHLSVPGLRALPVALQRRAVMKWLRTQNISEVGFDVIERVRSLADRETPIAKVNLPRDCHARRRAGKIFLE
ncbi:MAG: tRNA lysidine(34) synthetase TilS [Verrucomicrobia bacterium]|nr:MAG: tRNA lysidine(34) synthetase TilS [Verrucomicrobiota bacterium]PYJ34956.1 MAG: tRNA lysidine(34) synthetase TilS [Verrucomicrobiota bacterium]